MRLPSLDATVREHAGEFICELIRSPGETKVVAFHHEVSPSVGSGGLPDLGSLRDFYDTFGSVEFYRDATDDVAFRIASPGEWDELKAEFRAWFEDAPDLAEFVPPWVGDCVVFGEQPRTGNYLHLPTTGAVAGRVFRFEHDGFDFPEIADHLIAFVERLLEPDHEMLMEIASHKRFVTDDDWSVQWWMREMRDNRGRVMRTS